MEGGKIQAVTTDGLTLHGFAAQPDSRKLRIAVLVIHGIGEHHGRYSRVFDFLLARDFAVASFDLRGHGKSDGKQGDIPHYESLLDDIDLMTTEVRRSLGEVNVALYGHSLGANIVLNHVLRRPGTVAAAVGTAAWIRTAFAPPHWKTTLGKLLRNLCPSCTVGNELDPQWATRNADVLEELRNDPLMHNRISARMYFETVDAGEWALQHAGNLSVPVLLMHGTSDRYTSLEAARTFATRAGKRCTFKPWDGLYHLLHYEPEREQVLDCAAEWLLRQLRK